MDKQNLLRAVRDGDFGALLALADMYLEDGQDAMHSKINHVLIRAKILSKWEWDGINQPICPSDRMREKLRTMLDEINELEGGPWVLRYPSCYHWWTDMAEKSLTHYNPNLITWAQIVGHVRQSEPAVEPETNEIPAELPPTE